MYLSPILSELKKKEGKHHIYIPYIWSEFQAGKREKVDYASFIGRQIEIIINGKKQKLAGTKNWTQNAIVYNMFVRFFSAYDHNGDGIIGSKSGDITLNSKGLRETGTFLKAIALLPYLKFLGINTIHLLPVTEIGVIGRKGNLGSPYAIKNPYKIDPTLADPILEHQSVDHQYKAFVEAAHRLGIRIVQEFIFRTAAIDADWAHEHPEWFYWIKSEVNYGAPTFTSNQLKSILKVPEGKGEFIPPSREYCNLFVKPPKTQQHNYQVASAFADWPPDDLQPPWSDVTYFRLYNYPLQRKNNFNYIAYNTIRFYDPELARPENVNTPLWDEIAKIIPYYQENFGIDGAMIDMGHALPNELKTNIISEARRKDKNFVFWDENFDNKSETKKEGYDAVIGDAWYKITKRNGFKKIILSVNDQRPLNFFGTPETHNSPRFGYRQLKKKQAAWLLFNLLPGSISFLHNGFELNEKIPVNTGLNFRKAEIDFLSNKNLPLFYKNGLDWDTRSNSIPFIRKIAELRKAYPWIFKKKNISIVETDNNKIWGFRILHSGNAAVVLFNVNFKKTERFTITGDLIGNYRDLLNNKSVTLDKTCSLAPGSLLILFKDQLAGR